MNQIEFIQKLLKMFVKVIQQDTKKYNNITHLRRII